MFWISIFLRFLWSGFSLIIFELFKILRNKPWEDSNQLGVFKNQPSKIVFHQKKLRWNLNLVPTRASPLRLPRSKLTLRATETATMDSNRIMAVTTHHLSQLESREDQRTGTIGGNMGRNKWKEAKTREAITSAHTPIAQLRRKWKDPWKARSLRLSTKVLITIPSLSLPGDHHYHLLKQFKLPILPTMKFLISHLWRMALDKWIPLQHQRIHQSPWGMMTLSRALRRVNQEEMTSMKMNLRPKDGKSHTTDFTQ